MVGWVHTFMSSLPKYILNDTKGIIKKSYQSSLTKIKRGGASGHKKFPHSCGRLKVGEIVVTAEAVWRQSLEYSPRDGCSQEGSCSVL